MMKRSILFSVLLAVWGQAVGQPMMLQYDRPADYFEESLPIGNGKLGALVYGGVQDNVIFLNDITLWTGKPVDRELDRDAHQWIPKIREALFREDYAAADSLQLHVQGPNSQYYQPLATLHIQDLNATSETQEKAGAVTDYRRSLSLDSAIVKDSYAVNGQQVTREYFASHPDKLIAIRLRGAVNCRIFLTAQVPHKVKTNGPPALGVAEKGRWGRSGQLTLTGHATGDALESIHFCTILKANTDGDVMYSDSSLTIRDAHEAVIYVVNETSFNGFDKHPVNDGAPYLDAVVNDVWHTENYSYDEFRQRHINDYRQYYSRMSLQLGEAAYDGTTDQLLKQYTEQAGQHPEAERYLETLYFQFGRYLLISCSRTPGVPANLQGLWAHQLWSPWRGNYTVNINLEENYWPVFVSNLAEMAQPLDAFIQALATNGKFTARNYYGIETGWCSSHNSDLWAMTNPVGEKREKPMWANWNMGGAWLVNTLWERYLFTQDTDYLRTVAYPLMKGAADFCVAWLVDNPKVAGELITAPSTSPENEYVTDKGYHGVTCYGGTADLAIIRELLTNTVAACSVVGVDNAKYRTVLGRLHPYTVGAKGDLNEWYYDWQDFDPLHRHQSHLIGLYPGNHLLRDGNAQARQKLANACEQTLIQKGDETTGWSTGWRINLWARLKKAEQAYHIYRKLLTYVEPSGGKSPNYQHGGGTYANLFDAHPPFQIDGNFGGVAGVCEMLVQSHSILQFDNLQFTIELLPALPEAWKDGSVKGLCARGGYEIDMTWKDGQVTELQIYGKRSGKVTVRYNGKERKVNVTPYSDQGQGKY